MKDLTITIEIHSDKSIRLKENDKAVSYKSDNYYYPLLFAVVDKIHDAITDEKESVYDVDLDLLNEYKEWIFEIRALKEMTDKFNEVELWTMI